jgi:RHS repeat-associated protein
VTDSTQAVTATKTTDAFGVAVASTGSSTNPYTFAATSRYRNDGDAGLTHVGARYYDAQVGRFVTRDTVLSGLVRPCRGHEPATRRDPGADVWRNTRTSYINTK